MQESKTARSRDRSQKVENRRQSNNAKNVKMKNVEMFNKREQVFQDSTAQEFSRFKRVEMKMTTMHNEMIDSKIKHAVYRVNSALNRKRERR
jgi:hypothetical protein